MFDLCAVMDVNGDVFAAKSGAEVLRAANENQDDTLAAFLLATRKSLDLATRSQIDKLALTVRQMIVMIEIRAHLIRSIQHWEGIVLWQGGTK